MSGEGLITGIMRRQWYNKQDKYLTKFKSKKLEQGLYQVEEWVEGSMGDAAKGGDADVRVEQWNNYIKSIGEGEQK